MTNPLEKQLDYVRQLDPEAGLAYIKMAREQLAAERAIEAEAAARAQMWADAIHGAEQLLRMHGIQVAADAGEITQEQALRQMLQKQPSIGEAVLGVMRTQNQGWTAREVFTALERRGWTPPVAHPLRGVEAAINRLYRSGKVEKLGRGRYRATT